MESAGGVLGAQASPPASFVSEAFDETAQFLYGRL
jgi:hypothetical protein